MGAHPRVRGDIGSSTIPALPAGGSPPRARGHRGVKLAELRREGLTPACAGTSRRIWRGPGSAWAHPRVRGDIYDLWVERTSWRGSPPRARGHHRSRRHTGSCGGLTPACAGTSTSVGCGMWRLRAHPRVRGDIWAPGVAWGVWEGSPPRARGHPVCQRCGLRGGGLTPACAGTSVRRPTCRRRRRWLTPACAGTSANRRLGCPRAGAHPRVRGDITSRALGVSLRRGSPPRARGHLGCGVGGVGDRGLTPACAGTSTWVASGSSISGAHPRVRGDISRFAYSSDRAVGSPPRARGHPTVAQSCLSSSGLTPACAGTSRSG